MYADKKVKKVGHFQTVKTWLKKILFILNYLSLAKHLRRQGCFFDGDTSSTIMYLYKLTGQFLSSGALYFRNSHNFSHTIHYLNFS